MPTTYHLRNAAGSDFLVIPSQALPTQSNKLKFASVRDIMQWCQNALAWRGGPHAIS